MNSFMKGSVCKPATPAVHRQRYSHIETDADETNNSNEKSDFLAFDILRLDRARWRCNGPRRCGQAVPNVPIPQKAPTDGQGRKANPVVRCWNATGIWSLILVEGSEGFRLAARTVKATEREGMVFPFGLQSINLNEVGFLPRWPTSAPLGHGRLLMELEGSRRSRKAQPIGGGAEPDSEFPSILL